MAASGEVALYHIDGMTPEAHLTETNGLEKMSVNDQDLNDTFSKLSTGKEPTL